MEIKQCILTKNDCYKKGAKISPIGIIVHSTGANNTTLKRYLAPDDGFIGKNQYNNHWNQSGVTKCVHAFIGTDVSGNVRCYQTLPWDMRCWGCGSGTKGSYNNGYIQFEIEEDGLSNEKYFTDAFNTAISLCKYLMDKYPSINVENVISHKEAHERGYASDHGDCDYWLKKFGKDMNWFREQLVGKTSVTLKCHRENGEWGNGKVGNIIDAFTIKSSQGKITYVAHKKNGSWGKEITGYSTSNTDKYAGSIGTPIDAISIKASGIVGKLQYRVHRKADNKWGGWISGYSTTDTSKYAGSIGKEIDAIEVKIV